MVISGNSSLIHPLIRSYRVLYADYLREIAAKDAEIAAKDAKIDTLKGAYDELLRECVKQNCLPKPPKCRHEQTKGG
jgi:hypothetical protein